MRFKDALPEGRVLVHVQWSLIRPGDFGSLNERGGTQGPQQPCKEDSSYAARNEVTGAGEWSHRMGKEVNS